MFIILLFLLLAILGVIFTDDYLYIIFFLFCFFFFSGVHFFFLGFPIFAFIFLMVYSGAIAIIYIFVLQLVYVNRYKFFKFYQSYLLFGVSCLMLLVLLGVGLEQNTVFENLYLWNDFTLESTNFFTKFALSFYSNKSYFIFLLSFAILLGLKFSLRISNFESLHLVAHQINQLNRQNYIILC